MATIIMMGMTILNNSTCAVPVLCSTWSSCLARCRASFPPQPATSNSSEQPANRTAATIYFCFETTAVEAVVELEEALSGWVGVRHASTVDEGHVAHL